MTEIKDLNKHYYGFWSVTWVTRAGVAAFVFFTHSVLPNNFSLFHISLLLWLYLAMLTLVGFTWPEARHQKKTRFATNATDIVFVTILIGLTGGQQSPWFLLYIFPILYAAKRPSGLRSLWMAVLIAVTYAVALPVLYDSDIMGPGDDLNLLLLVVYSTTLLAVGKVADELTTLREANKDFIDAIRSIHRGITHQQSKDDILQTITSQAQRYTRSDSAMMLLQQTASQKPTRVILAGALNKPEWGLQPFIERLSAQVIETGEAVLFQTIRRTHLQRLLNRTDKTGLPRLTSFMLVPIKYKNRVTGTLCVSVTEGYSLSKWHLHTDVELEILGLFGSLTAIALRTTEDSEERKKRLQGLYEIGQLLKTTSNLKDLYDQVVSVTCHRLNAEECSLFVPDNGTIIKAAVSAPSPAIEEALWSVNESYKKGESYAGSIFKTGHKVVKNDIPDEIAFVPEYSKSLPSNKTKHYIGVLLNDDDDQFGVLRVINKKASNYSLEMGQYDLSPDGFQKEDIELMETIASLVAVAIRNVQLLEESQEAQRYFENLVLNLPDPIMVLDAKVRVETVNRVCEEIYGANSAEMKGKSVMEFYESKDEADRIKSLLGKSKDRRIQNIETRFKAKDRSLIPVALSTTFLLNEDGKRIGNIAIFKDLRETKRLQEQLVQNEKLAVVGKLTRTMAHEIKHEIGAAKFYIQTLSRRFKDNKENLELLAQINTSLNNSVDGLKNMLTAGKPGAPKKYDYSLDDLKTTLQKTLARRAKDQGIALNIMLPHEPGQVSVDLDLMKQVFSNLYTNSVYAIGARKHTDETFAAGRIDVSMSLNGKNVRIEWMDNGCGIAADDLPHIFKPFFTNKEADDGTGLGLFNVNSIIQQHSGAITADSVIGKHTRFTITLPRATEHVTLGTHEPATS